MSLSFLEPDDYIILMAAPGNEHSFSVRDLSAIRDTGVKTIMRYILWENIERTPGNFDWEDTERLINDDRQAGMKTLLAVYEEAPAFFDHEFYMHDLQGQRYVGPYYRNMIAPWADGWRFHIDFIKQCCVRFNASDVLCMRATCHGGELIFPGGDRFWYPPTINLHDLAKQVMLQEQEIFHTTTSYPDLFTALHHCFDCNPLSCNMDMDYLYRVLREKFPDMVHNNITFELFGDAPCRELHVSDIKTYGYREICGSGYCEGLLENTEQAIAFGVSTFLTGPLHYLGKHEQIEPWMIEAFRDSISKWRAASVLRST